ncbi:MAG: hypothetical protein LBJ62_10955 [Bifidobacteriaceae bacterium]|jgi:uncharacterized membrane protein|nr:hypothetical protein [Bifidobacteriaceae bacterium]
MSSQYPSPPQGQPDPAADIQQNKVMAVLAYIGLLVLIPLIAAKDSKFARYHANQGLVLLVAEIAYGVIYGIVIGIASAGAVAAASAGSAAGLAGAGIVSLLLGLIGIVFLVFAIIGIVNAAKGEFKPLPLIGKITFLK